MKPTLKYIFILIGVLLVLAYLFLSLTNLTEKSNQKVCKRLEIELADSAKIQLLRETDIALMLELRDLNPVGKALKHIRTESIEDALRKNPMVKEAECYKTPSGIVHVRIVQRRPKFRVMGMENYYVDVDRKRLPISLNYAAFVPIVSGRVTKSMASSKLFDFVTFLEENPFWNAQIEQIYVRDDQKIELVPRVGDGIIVLGTLNDFALKLEKLRRLYVGGFNVIGWNRYKVIDLQYKDQVVCTKVDQLSELTK